MGNVFTKQLIEEMEQCTSYSNQIKGWKEDYKKLKSYRHIRNCIAHESNFYEKDYCSSEDIMWIKDFHQRILNSTDPLALYEKTKKQYASKKQKINVKQLQQEEIGYAMPRRSIISKIKQMLGFRRY